MARLPLVDPAAASGKTAKLLEAVQAKMGRVPNIVRVFANSPAALEAYLGFSGALAASKLSAKFRERVALLVAQVSECRYCVAAHTAIGKSVGLGADEIAAALRGEAPGSKEASGLLFARRLVEARGQVSEADLAAVRRGGYEEGEIVELVAVVLLNLFTNYINHVADTEVDF